MIGMLAGTVVYRAADHVLLDTGGVGYQVYCSERTLAEVSDLGARLTLYTDLLVREDLLQLFGFQTIAERELHRLLISVQGVGAKASLSILGTLGQEGTLQAISLGNWGAIRAAHGVGPKIAQRVVNELADKIGVILALGVGIQPDSSAELPAGAEGGAVAGVEGGASASSSARAEALSALTNLGYAQSEAIKFIAEALAEFPDANTETVIREALRRMAPLV
ncbi:MAG: Holliday junction branch migration protein RuvA [Albidovulum sp.]|nr:Holliday junction branch migration protein RuvA [Albidovulum sp.]